MVNTWRKWLSERRVHSHLRCMATARQRRNVKGAEKNPAKVLPGKSFEPGTGRYGIFSSVPFTLDVRGEDALPLRRKWMNAYA